MTLDHRENIDALRRAANPDPASAPLDLDAERARLAKEQADSAALKNAQLRGELVAAHDLDHALLTLATAVSGRLQGIPSAVAAELAAESSAPECEAIVRRGIESALRDLADAGCAAAERIAAQEDK